MLTCILIAAVFSLILSEVRSLRETSNQRIEKITKKVAPTATEVNRLKELLLSASQKLTKLQKSTDEEDYKKYQEYFKQTQKILGQLQRELGKQPNSNDVNNNKFSQVQEKLLKIGVHAKQLKEVMQASNVQYPARELSLKKVAPVITGVSEKVNQFMSTVTNPIPTAAIIEDIDVVNRQIYISKKMIQFQSHWTQIIISYKAFLSSRDKKISSIINLHSQKINKIFIDIKKPEVKLTPQQRKVVDSLKSEFDRFAKAAEPVIKLHVSDQWRISPMKGKLSEHNSNIHLLLASIQKALQSLNQDVKAQGAKFSSNISEPVDSMLASAKPINKLHQSQRWKLNQKLAFSKKVPAVLEQIQKIITSLHYTFNRKFDGKKKLSSKATAATDVDTVKPVVIKIIIYAAIAIGLVLVLVFGFLNKLARITREIEKIAYKESDALQKLEVRGSNELTKLAETFNRILEQGDDSLELAYESAMALKSKISKCKGNAENAQTEAKKQQDQADRIVTTISEVSSQTDQMTHSSEEAAQYATEISQRSEECKKVVEEFIEDSNLLASDVKSVSTQLDQLDKDSKNIENVLSVIKGISEQTNLLALNAAIEAARAGEQGRGFAIVADEVRTLSHRTQAEAEKIEKAIASLCSRVDQATHSMKTGVSKADTSVEAALKTGQLLGDINDSCAASLKTYNQIAGASEAQSEQIHELWASVNLLKSQVESSTNEVASSVSSSHELDQMAEQLSGLIDKSMK